MVWVPDAEQCQAGVISRFVIYRAGEHCMSVRLRAVCHPEDAMEGGRCQQEAEVPEQRATACSLTLHYASPPLPVQTVIKEPREASVSLAAPVSCLASF